MIVMSPTEVEVVAGNGSKSSVQSTLWIGQLSARLGFAGEGMQGLNHPPLTASLSTRQTAAPETLARLQANVNSVLLGKPDVTRLALTALLAEGHLLLEDVPGVGKTLLAKALAKSLACTFHRIQF